MTAGPDLEARVAKLERRLEAAASRFAEFDAKVKGLEDELRTLRSGLVAGAKGMVAQLGARHRLEYLRGLRAVRSVDVPDR